MISIEKFKSNDTDLYQESLKIRTTVFVEEQNVPAELEYENEEEAINFIGFLNKKAVGTARYRITKKGIKFERFAVLQEFRGKGVAKKLLLFMLNELKENDNQIYLHAQSDVIDFYSKYGFSVIGNEFEEAGIKHKLMQFAL